MAFILIAIAAILNACMDKVENQIQFNSSVFKKLDPLFFCKSISANKPFIPGTKFRADFWHLCKSAAGACMLIAIWIGYQSKFGVIDLAVMFGCWIIPFNLFYNKILKA